VQVEGSVALIALMCAQEGASVVVNDYGAAANGSGADAGPAHDVVEEIKTAGGSAVANTSSIRRPGGRGIDHSGRDFEVWSH